MYDARMEQLMILITSIDEKASIRYSQSTGMFYMHSDIWRWNGFHYQNVPIHRHTIVEVIRDFYETIQGTLIRVGSGNKNVKAYRLPILVPPKNNEKST
jgi:hypothetical protein